MYEKAKAFPIRTSFAFGLCINGKLMNVGGLMVLDTCTMTLGQELCSHQYTKNLFLVHSAKKQHWSPCEQPSKSYKYLWKQSHTFVREEKMLIGSVFPWCVLGDDLTLIFFYVWWHLAVNAVGCSFLFWLSFWLCWVFFFLLLAALWFFCFVFLFCLVFRKTASLLQVLISQIT